MVLCSPLGAIKIWRQPPQESLVYCRSTTLRWRAQKHQTIAGSGSQPDRRGLVQTFADKFTSFSWHADEALEGPSESGFWRPHFGFAGANDRGSRPPEQRATADLRRSPRPRAEGAWAFPQILVVDWVRVYKVQM